MPSGHISHVAHVYMLFDPRTLMPFYVGVGLKKRPWYHFRVSCGVKNPDRWAKIQELRAAGIADKAMVAYVAHDLTAEEAMTTEEWLVASWGRVSAGDGLLLNATAGGARHPLEDSATLAKIKSTQSTPEYKARWSAAASAAFARPDAKERLTNAIKANWAKPEVRARILEGHAKPEVRAKMRASMKAHRNTPEFKAASSAWMRAKWADPAFRAKLADPDHRAKQSAALKAAWVRRKAAKAKAEGEP